MDEALALHARFKALPGSEQIATPFAIHALRQFLWTHAPRRILEVGAGIGSLSWVLADYLTYLCGYAEAVSVEDDPWCRTEWERNLAPWRRRPLLFDKVPPYEFYDLVVLDGPQMPADGWACLAPGASVFVEGNRREQRAALRLSMRQQGRRYIETPSRPPDRSKGVWLGRCDPAWWERVLFTTNRLEQWGRDLPTRWRGEPIGKRRHA